MDDIKINNLNDLYHKLLPALKTRKREMALSGFKEAKTDDMFNYLTKYRWKNNKRVALCEMVQSIFDMEIADLNLYIKRHKNNKTRK